MSDEHGKKHRKKNEAKHKADDEQEREKDRASEKDERRKSKSKGKRKELKDKSGDTDKAKRSKPSKNSKVKKKQREASSSSSPTTAASPLPLSEPFQAEPTSQDVDAEEPGSQLIDCVAPSQAGESSEQIIDNYGGYQLRWIEDGEECYEEEEGGNWLMEEELFNEEKHKLEEFDTRLETMSTNEIKFLIRDLARGLEADSDDTLEPHLGAGSTHGALLPSPQQPLAESTPMRAYPAEIHFPFVKIEGTPRQTFAGVSSGPVTLIPRFLSSELNQADLFI